MSYPRDLDECPEEALMSELIYRAEQRKEGRCDYCGCPIDTPPCKFPDRHSGRALTVKR